MNHNNYQQGIGATAACTNRIMEATKGVGQKYRKGETKDCFLFDSWLSSEKLAEATMEVGSKFIGVINTNTKVFCKETIDKLTKYWPGDSYLVLRSNHMVPGGRPLIVIGCKYNTRKVLYFIVTDNAGSTQAGLPYLSKYPGQFSNLSIRPVSCPLVVYKFFGAVN